MIHIHTCMISITFESWKVLRLTCCLYTYVLYMLVVLFAIQTQKTIHFLSLFRNCLWSNLAVRMLRWMSLLTTMTHILFSLFWMSLESVGNSHGSSSVWSSCGQRLTSLDVIWPIRVAVDGHNVVLGSLQIYSLSLSFYVILLASAHFFWLGLSV